MMRKIRFSRLLTVLLVGLALILITGCYKKAAPDVTETPAGAGAQADQPEATPANLETVIAATAIAETTRVAAAAPPTLPPPPPTETPVVAPAPAEEAIPTPFPTVDLASVAAPTFTPPPAAEGVALQPSGGVGTPPYPGPIKHIVQPGENLFRISLRYGLTVPEVAAANGIANPALIYVGQELTIPAGGAVQPPPPGVESTYVVKPGDNLFRIALRYNMSYMYLAQYNRITNPSTIYVGQVIRIP